MREDMVKHFFIKKKIKWREKILFPKANAKKARLKDLTSVDFNVQLPPLFVHAAVTASF